MKPPEFILLASVSEVEGTKRKHLWGPVILLLPLSGRAKALGSDPATRATGVLTAQLAPTEKVKTLSESPSLSSSTRHMLFKKHMAGNQTSTLPTIKAPNRWQSDATSDASLRIGW